MAKEIKFNVKLVVDGKEQLVTATTATGELRRALDSAKTSGQKLNGALTKISQAITVANNATDAISRISGALNDVTEESRGFSAAMNAANTMAGKSGEDFAKLKEQVAELSKTIPVVRDELANGLYQVISSGVPEDNWITFLQKSAKASVGGIADLGETVKVTSTIIKNYGLSWDNAGDVQDKIQLTAKNGVTSFEQLAQALPRVTSNAATLGVSVDELMATFATLTGVSGNTAEVSTQLAAIFTALVKPSQEASKMARQMGVEFDAAAIKAAGGMRNFLTDLDKNVKAYATKSGMLEQEIYGKLFGSAESLRALTPLTGQLAAKFNENVEAMKDSAGTVDEAFSIMSSSGSASLQMLKNKFAEAGDAIASTMGGIMPVFNIAAQIGYTVTAVSAMTNGLMNLAKIQAVVTVRTTAMNAASRVWNATSVHMNALVQVLSASFRGAAVSATTLKLAIRGLLISTGVGAAIAGLTILIEHLAAGSEKAADKTNELSEADEAFKSAAAGVIVEIDKEIRELGKLISAKGDTAEAVDRLNTKYGELFGRHKTASEWYDTLTRKSKIYAKQIGYEAQARAIATELAKKEIELEENFAARRELWKNGKAKTREKRHHANSKTGSFNEFSGPEKDTPEYKGLKDDAKPLIADINRLRKDLDFALKGVNDNAALLKTPDANENGGKGKGGDDSPTTTTTPSTPKPAKAAPAKDGSLDWYADKMEALRKAIRATADEEEARKLREQYKAYEEKYKALEVSIGLKEPDEEEVKTHVEKLQDKLTQAQKDFDEAIDVEAKVKAAAEVSKLQAEIDEATVGRITIKADVEPTYIEKGSADDKRLSYGNARQKADRIQHDYEIGIIGKDEALRQIGELNKAVTELGMNPIHIDVETEDLEKARARAQDTRNALLNGWDGIKGVGDGIQNMTSTLEGNANAWEKVKAVIDGTIGIIQGVSAVVGMVNALGGMQEGMAASAAGSTGAAAAAGAAASAATAGQAAQIAIAPEVIVANKLMTASYMELASAMYFAAHASIPLIGFGIAQGFITSATAMVQAIGVMPFAKGGVVSGPTLALVGEYAGASNNPEVIAPLDKLRSMLQPRGMMQGGSVHFEIDGRKLVGVLANETRIGSRSGRRSNIII